MQYFQGLTSESEIKARYKELAKKNHPDLGGCLETMKIINAQYEKVMTGAYQKAGKSISEIDELLKQDEALRNALNSIVHLEEIIIEICGSWLWVNGNTKIYKDTLKANSFKWSQNKACWYWHPPTYKRLHRKKFSMDEIRTLHGSLAIERKNRILITN